MFAPPVVVALMLAASSPMDDARFTVTADLSAVDGATMGDEVINAAYKSLLLRLIEEGYLVAEPGRGGDIMVKVVPSGERSTIAIVVRTSIGEAERVVPGGSRAGEEVQIHFVHEALDLVHQAREGLVLARQRKATAPAVSSLPPAPRPAATPGTASARAARMAVRVGGAAMWSGSSPGMLANLDGVMIRGRWQVALGGFVHAPLDLPNELHIVEWGGWASVGLAGRIAARIEAEASLAAGFADHAYRYADAAGASDRGSLWDALAAPRAAIKLRLSPRWRLGVFSGALITMHDRRHITATQSLWHGPHFRPFVGLVAELVP